MNGLHVASSLIPRVICLPQENSGENHSSIILLYHHHHHHHHHHGPTIPPYRGNDGSGGITIANSRSCLFIPNIIKNNNKSYNNDNNSIIVSNNCHTKAITNHARLDCPSVVPIHETFHVSAATTTNTTATTTTTTTTKTIPANRWQQQSRPLWWKTNYR
jgi:hypothetical protein